MPPVAPQRGLCRTVRLSESGARYLDSLHPDETAYLRRLNAQRGHETKDKNDPER